MIKYIICLCLLCLGTHAYASEEDTQKTTTPFSIQQKHSPSRFTTASIGVVILKVKNKSDRHIDSVFLRGELPKGLSVPQRTFKAGKWQCQGDDIIDVGQTFLCHHTKTLKSGSSSKFNINIHIAPKDQFEKDTTSIKLCFHASSDKAIFSMTHPENRSCEDIRLKLSDSQSTMKLNMSTGSVLGMGNNRSNQR